MFYLIGGYKISPHPRFHVVVGPGDNIKKVLHRSRCSSSSSYDCFQPSRASEYSTSLVSELILVAQPIIQGEQPKPSLVGYRKIDI